MKQIDTPYLFVYGTLMSFHYSPASRCLAKMADVIGFTNVRGTMYHAGWYPTVVVWSRGIVIVGQLIKLRNRSKVIQFLDKYEGAYLYGSDYLREVVQVNSPQGKTVLAQIYVSKNAKPGLPVILKGKFRFKNCAKTGF